MTDTRPGAMTDAVRAFVAGWHCPDCDSTTTLRRVGDGVYDVEMRHDGTCPWLARQKHRR